MAKVLIFTFDFLRKGEPRKGYSIASIAAYAKRHLNDLTIDYVSLNMARPWFIFRLRNVREFCNFHRLHTYDAVLIPDYVWSGNACARLASWLRRFGYAGKIIVGGYQVTATPDELMDEYYPCADHCIKGYAEEAICSAITGNAQGKVLSVPISSDRLVSPYLSGEIRLVREVRSARWETKRGCPYKCGFCEWSALPDRRLHYIDCGRLLEELALFRRSGVQKVNVLDGTFNVGANHVELMDAIGGVTGAVFHFQVRPELLATPKGEEFLAKCAKYRNAYLEMGIQTIIPEEMQVIGRQNNIEAIEHALRRLKELQVPYETNLIYGIPGQTVSSFHDSINFLVRNGCPVEKIRAYALRLPRTSAIRKGIYAIKESSSPAGGNVFLSEWWYQIRLVTETRSFDRLEWETMYRTAEALTKGKAMTREVALGRITAEARRLERYAAGSLKGFRLHVYNGKSTDSLISQRVRLRIGKDKWLTFTPSRFLCLYLFLLRDASLIRSSRLTADGQLLLPKQFSLSLPNHKLQCRPGIWRRPLPVADMELSDGFIDLTLSPRA